MNIKIDEIIFYRMAINETYYDSFEVINDINRFIECPIILCELSYRIDEKGYEYIITYSRNEKGGIEAESIKLKYYDFVESEDYKRIEEKMSSTMNLIARGLIPQLLAIIKNTRKD